jgi:hypothetical protein
VRLRFEGKAVCVKLDKALGRRIYIKAKIKQGLLLVNANGVVTDRFRKKPTVQWKGDAANIHKEMKQT